MQYRFVLIGCGRIAHRHIAQVNRVGICVGATDPNPVRLNDFTRQYMVPGYDSIERLLISVEADIAVICSPNHLHITHITCALTHGLHVLCEKPLCIRPEEASSLKQLQESTRKMVFMVLSARFHDQVIRLGQLLQEGRLGKVISFHLNACWNRPAAYFRESDWKGTADKDGGVLYTQFSHYLDAMTWCLGECQVVSVRRANMMHAGIIEGEDTGAAILQTRAGAIGTISWTVNSTLKNMEVSLQVVGDAGTIKIGGEYMDKLEYEALLSPAPAPLPNVAQNSGGSHHDLIYDELMRAMNNEPHRLPGMESGLLSVNLITDIYNFPQDSILQRWHE